MIGVKYLNPVIVAIRYMKVSTRINGDAKRMIKVAIIV